MIEKLLKAAYYYYVKNAPIMSDSEYDALFKECKELEKHLPPHLRITDKVCLGYFEGVSRTKLQHPIPMLSIEKDNDRVEFPVVQTPKLDGVALELCYRYGNLTAKITRGDGYIGADVTKQPIQDIPTKVPKWVDKQLIIVRGEVICDKWEGKTHRNYVAGMINTLDIEEVEKAGLRFIAYFVYGDYIIDYVTQLHSLKDNGFVIPPFIVHITPGEYLFTPLTDVPTDGFVFRKRYSGTDTESTAHHYKHSWAWKPEAQEVDSTVIGVDWTQSKNNIWTPVALIQPVEIDGTVISRVNLASIAYIEERDIAIHDSVMVRKAKEIIPEIASVTHRPLHRIPIELEYCPSCGEELVVDGIYLKCPAKNCASVKLLSFFCKEIGIKGLADKSIAKLDISRPYELYKISEEDLEFVLGKKAIQVYKEIKNSKKAPLELLLSALNVPSAKETTLKKIFQEITSWEDLKDYQKLISVKGIGEVKAKSISDWVADNYNELLIYEKLGFSFKINNLRASLTKKIAVTGSFSDITRTAFKEMMGTKGVAISENVTKDCVALIVGTKPSQSKIDKAVSYKIPIVDYFRFRSDLYDIFNKTN